MLYFTIAIMFFSWIAFDAMLLTNQESQRLVVEMSRRKRGRLEDRN